MHDNFDHIENELLRAWNRSETLANILQAKGEEEAKSYYEQFDGEAQNKMAFILMMVSAKGKPHVYKLVQDSMKVEEGE